MTKFNFGLFGLWAVGHCVGAVEPGPVITLPASNAIVHAVTMRYEPQPNKNCLGYWTNPADWAEWKFQVPASGTYEIEIWQGCGKGQGGSEVQVEVAGKKFSFVVEDTGHFQNFVGRNIGAVEFPSAGDYTLAIKPQNKKAAAVMDVREARLIPVQNTASSPQPFARILSARRVVFLGDSITHSGEYVEMIEAYVRMKYPDAAVEFINLGLPSETVSGLTEPGHAGGSFPRPDLHERLERILEMAKPDLIFACYGMNDGIYYPFGEERFQTFQKGILKLRERAAAAGARVIHITPPTFDPVPIKDSTLPAGKEEYRQPYAGYNEVLDRYSQWLVSKRAEQWDVIDIHGPMNASLAAHRASNPQFRFANDGVHANAEGHWIIAREILRYFGAPDDIVLADSSEALLHLNSNAAEIMALVRKRQHLLRDAWISGVGHKRPGMGKGKPLPEAEGEAAQLLQQIRVLAAASR